MRSGRRRLIEAYFIAGDCLSSMAAGAATGLLVRLAVGPEWDLALAMLAGMAIGMVVHLGLGAAFSPLFGGIEQMTASGLAAMYGGMFFAMRDAMHPEPVSLGHAGWVGVLFGLLVWSGVAAYDRMVRGVVFDSGTVRAGAGGRGTE